MKLKGQSLHYAWFFFPRIIKPSFLSSFIQRVTEEGLVPNLLAKIVFFLTCIFGESLIAIQRHLAPGESSRL